MVHEITVDFIIDVVAIEVEVARVLHPFSDDFPLIVQRIGIVDVAFFEWELGTVAHDVTIDEAVLDDVSHLSDRVWLSGHDMVGDTRLLPSCFHRMCHLRSEIADVVEVPHHLVG